MGSYLHFYLCGRVKMKRLPFSNAILLFSILCLACCTPQAEDPSSVIETVASDAVVASAFDSSTADTQKATPLPTDAPAPTIAVNNADPNSLPPYLQGGTYWARETEPWSNHFVVPAAGDCYAVMNGQVYHMEFSQDAASVCFCISFRATYDGDVLLSVPALSAAYSYTEDSCRLCFTEDVFGVFGGALPTYTFLRGEMPSTVPQSEPLSDYYCHPALQLDTDWFWRSDDNSYDLRLQVDAQGRCSIRQRHWLDQGSAEMTYAVLWNFGGSDVLLATTTRENGVTQYLPYLYGQMQSAHYGVWNATAASALLVTKVPGDAPFTVGESLAFSRSYVDRELYLGLPLEYAELYCLKNGLQFRDYFGDSNSHYFGVYVIYGADTITLLHNEYDYSTPLWGFSYVDAYASYDRATGKLLFYEGCFPLDTQLAGSYQASDDSCFYAYCGYDGLCASEEGQVYFMDTCCFVVWEDYGGYHSCDCFYQLYDPLAAE